MYHLLQDLPVKHSSQQLVQHDSPHDVASLQACLAKFAMLYQYAPIKATTANHIDQILK
jgi:hypothetical protein